MLTRGIFVCNKIAKTTWSQDLRIVTLSAVCTNYTSENERFHRFTPSGMIEINVDNPKVVFELGKNYYVDFTEAP